jgi:hypothetical protein
MALIKCYECEREISDKAPACPQCGAPKKKVAPKKKSSAPKKKARPERKVGRKEKPSAQEMDRIIKEVLAKKAKKARKKSSAPKKKAATTKKRAAVRVKESTPVSRDDSMTEVVMGVIVPIYLVGWGIASLYEELMFFVEEGFVAWVLFGWVVPLFRALLWPLNVYQALVG